MSDTIHYKMRGSDTLHTCTKEEWDSMIKKHPRSFMKVPAPPVKQAKPAQPAQPTAADRKATDASGGGGTKDTRKGGTTTSNKA